MAFRLVATIDGKRVRVPLPSGEYLLGSHPECAVRLEHPSVSRRHAALTVDSSGVSVRDLDSRNGTRIGTERITVGRLEPGIPVTFGAVQAVLEELPEADLQAAVVLAGKAPVAIAPATPPDHTTWRSGMVETFALERLPNLVTRLCTGESAATMAQLVGEAIYTSLPCTEVSVIDDQSGGFLFTANREVGHPPSADMIAADAGRMRVEATFASPPIATMFRPLVEAAAHLLVAAQSRGSERLVPPTPKRQPPPFPDPPSVAPRLRQIYEAAARIASGRVSVLLLGESGTGKEVLARYVHSSSAEADGPFLALNCASLPRDLLESELFGIEKGVATGVEARPGKFELADRGTLFLDEIADMAAETQAKILRVLQSGEVFRLGGREPRTVRVRVIAATNRDVRRMLAEGSFRSDLYHRIAGWVVEVPPLRERRADIPNLAAFFLAREASRRGLRVAGISRAAIDALNAFHWPGNVRQLETEMARAVLFLEDGELLDTSRLGPEIREAPRGVEDGSLEATLRRVERDEIVRALEATSGSVEGAATRLGVSRATLYRRMKELAVDPRNE